MNEHSFDAFSLKMKESVKKKCRSAPRDEILSVKVDDLTGYETCYTDEKQRLKHGSVPTCACPWSHAHAPWLHIRVYKVREFGNLNAKCIYSMIENKGIATMVFSLITKSHVVHDVEFNQIRALNI